MNLGLIADFSILGATCMSLALAGYKTGPALGRAADKAATAHAGLVRAAERRDAEWKIRDSKSWLFRRRKF